MSYTVIFIDAKGPARLGAYEDKGAARRAWRTCNAGAAILGPDGTMLETKSGTTAPAEKKLRGYVEHLRRQGALEPAIPPRAPAPAAVEPDDEEDDEPDTTTYTRVDRIEQVDAMVARARERAAARESGASAEPVAAEHTRAAEAFHAVVEQAREAARAVDPRPAEVTHALDPATGAVVQGDDTERLQPPAAPARCGTAGCDHAPGIDRKNVLPAWRPFCGACRVVIRQRSRSMPGGVAAVIAHLRAGTLPPPSARHVAIGARGGKSPRRPPPAARRVADPASTLAAGLERVKRHAAVVDALGGVDQAEQLAAVVRDAGGVEVVVEALTELRSVA